ncbi:MAG: M28 family peptidase [Gemmiger sp.]|nr:M28 family peptidase [Gemmiger sp.]
MEETKTIARHLAALAQPDPDARRAALEAVLAAEGLTPTLQTGEGSEKYPRPVQNYLLLPPAGAAYPLLCAHYDAHPGSSGANDNAAAVCILVALAKALPPRGVRAGIAFLDGEESGHGGAKLFEAERGGLELSAVINLDVCGYGDSLAVYCKGGEKKPVAREFCDKKRLAAHGGRTVKFLPESDDKVFSTRAQPVLSVAALPLWDAKYMDALASYGEGILGRPPEFEMIMGQLEVISTMHGAFRDGVQWVQPAAMQRVYDYLLDALTAPPTPKRFGLF